MVATSPGPQRHRIAELVFAVEVGSRCNGLRGPEELSAAVRRELLPAIETALRAVEAEGQDLMIDEIELDLGETPEEPNWSDLRARLHNALVAALAARIVRKAHDLTDATSSPVPRAATNCSLAPSTAVPEGEMPDSVNGHRFDRNVGETIGRATVPSAPFHADLPSSPSAAEGHENLTAADGDLQTDSSTLLGAAGPLSPVAEPKDAFFDDISGRALGADRSHGGDLQSDVGGERSASPSGPEGIDDKEQQRLIQPLGSDAAPGVEDVPSRTGSVAKGRPSIIHGDHTVPHLLQEETSHGAENRIAVSGTKFAAGSGHEAVAGRNSAGASLSTIRDIGHEAGHSTGVSSSTTPATGSFEGTDGAPSPDEPRSARSHDSVAAGEKSASVGTAKEMMPTPSNTASSTEGPDSASQNLAATGNQRRRSEDRSSPPADDNESATSIEAGLESGRTERAHPGAEATLTTTGGVNEASTRGPEAGAQGGDAVHASAGQGGLAFDKHSTKHRKRGMPTGPAAPDAQPKTPLDLVSGSPGDAHIHPKAVFGPSDATGTSDDKAGDDQLSAPTTSDQGHTPSVVIRYSDPASGVGDDEPPNAHYRTEVRVDEIDGTDRAKDTVALEGTGTSDDDPTDPPVTPLSALPETVSHAQSSQRVRDFEPSTDPSPAPSYPNHDYPDAVDLGAGGAGGFLRDADRDPQGGSGLAIALSGLEGDELLRLALILLDDQRAGGGIDEPRAAALAELSATEDSFGRLLALVRLMLPEATQVPLEAAGGSSSQTMAPGAFRSRRAPGAGTDDTDPSRSKAGERAEVETEAAGSESVQGIEPSVNRSSAQGAPHPMPSDPMLLVHIAERLAEVTPFASLGMQEALGLIWSSLPETIRQNRTAQRVLLGATVAIAAEEGPRVDGLATLRGAVHDLLATAESEAQRRLAARMAFSRMRFAAAGSPRARTLARAALTAVMPGLAEPHADQQIALATNVAGLVLFAPYLRMLFDRGGVLDSEGRIPAAQLPRARALLTGLSSSAAPQPDPLERVLLGVVPGQSISPCTAIDDLAALTDGLVRAVIGQWGALGKTSPDGLRQAFIRREGDLTPEADGAVRLRVLPGPFDMLLDRLPWSISVIRTPWMLGPLHVRWRSDDNR